MATPPRVQPQRVVTVLEKLSAKIDPQTDPKLGSFLIEIVKSKDALARFKANPAAALTAHKLDPKLVNVRAVETLTDSILKRIAGLPRGGPVMESVSESQTSQSQERNFDHSSSWFTNFDGWNVMHDGGHSSEQSSGSSVGQDKNFGGITTVPGEELAREIQAVFYPGQPLVSPKLVDMIKAADREVGP